MFFRYGRHNGDPTEPPAREVALGLLNFLDGVHHKRPVGDDGLVNLNELLLPFPNETEPQRSET